MDTFDDTADDTFEETPEDASEETLEDTFEESFQTTEDNVEIDEGSQTADVDEETLDNIADTAIAVLQDILRYFNTGEITIDEYEGDERELILDITGDDLAILIGRHGKTLEAIQLLVSAITVRAVGFHYPLIIDVEGYKSRQRKKLENTARASANRAVKLQRDIKLRPMTPYERRIVHIALRDDNRVQTVSEDEGAMRHVVISPVQAPNVSRET